MKILIVTPYFPPEIGAGAVRMGELARSWSRNGNDVSVLTPYPSYPKGRIYSGYRRGFWMKEEMLNGVRVFRVPTLFAENRGIFLRVISYLSFLMSGCVFGSITKRPDVIVSTSPHLFSGLIGALLRFRFRTKFVFDVRDLWPEALGESLVRLPNVFIYGLRQLAKTLYRTAHLVVTTSDSQMEVVRQYGIPPKKVKVISNGVNTTLFSILDKEDDDVLAWRERLGLGQKKIVGYIGNLAFFYDFSLLCNAARRHLADPSVAFLVVGEGVLKEKIETAKNDYGLKNLKLWPAINYEEVPALLNCLDLGVVPHKRIPLTKTMRPVKLFEYWACGVPVILSSHGEAKRIYDGMDGSLSIEAGDEDAFHNVLGKALRDLPRYKEKSKQLADQVRATYSRAELARQYEDCLRWLLR